MSQRNPHTTTLFDAAIHTETITLFADIARENILRVADLRASLAALDIEITSIRHRLDGGRNVDAVDELEEEENHRTMALEALQYCNNILWLLEQIVECMTQIQVVDGLWGDAETYRYRGLINMFIQELGYEGNAVAILARLDELFE
ncbi:hypothetical protein H2202_007181 [Exophiala xenobiotica]|nr:hypothetical protein H2202_007181 [Exophiala xenobiotica]